mmetsp:Transcript_15227/g.49992  ORF Transcript_15227/g.49992 Transcript_15227/m.49992 type:complete len:480 (-) Transcript_15227:85-1524(-)|eukprot:CAMPEP_0170141642 /NCGR_PEP_ID=MMETSP0033_2-20121228/7136_1 /TAXON_ID=195969 /ORGANISM="Dolichomastix tenuilepis, Strain CCMP3274" /LENGTH=479 /DNA_ID=CAMNT_0010377925 /DNA_START=262 /DNA_END=1701 /DNA_ORIENTATION=-
MAAAEALAEPLLERAGEGSSRDDVEAAPSNAASADGGDGADGKSLWRELWESGACSLAPMVFLEGSAYVIAFAYLPFIQTDFFASEYAGVDVRCENYELGTRPDACVHGSHMAVSYNAFSSLAMNLISFFCVPLTGRASDVFGRRPLLVLGQTLMAGPIVVLYLYQSWGWTNLRFYWYMQGLTGIVQPFAIALAYIADCMRPARRGTAFGLLLGLFLAAATVVPFLSTFLSSQMAIRVGVTIFLINILYTIFFVREPRSSACVRTRAQKIVVKETWQRLRELWASPYFFRLALVAIFYGAVNVGLQSLDMQYYQLHLGFTSEDNGLYISTLGGVGTLGQTAVLHVALKYLGERRTLHASLVCGCLRCIALGMVQYKWEVFALCSLLGMQMCCFPALSALKANRAGDDEQGLVQGTLYGARCLGEAVGPLLLSALYTHYDDGGTKAAAGTFFALFPGGPPYLVAALLFACALISALTVPV